MKDSINRKAQQAALVETSDDRNGVVVNRAIDSTRGIPNCLVEQRCIKATTASSQIHAKSEYSDTSTIVGQKPGFLRISTARA